MSIYGFDIPHDAGEPCRDIIAVQIPYPPSKVGSILIPDLARQLGEHGVQAGIIRAMGPMAFTYKDGEGLKRQRADIGDWVLIRWGAGTMFQAGKGILNSISGWRYLSTFQDVIKIIPASAMPEASTLEWTDAGVLDNLQTQAQEMAEGRPRLFDKPLPDNTGVRERVVYKK
jgi:hypothetical protein